MTADLMTGFKNRPKCFGVFPGAKAEGKEGRLGVVGSKQLEQLRGELGSWAIVIGQNDRMGTRANFSQVSALDCAVEQGQSKPKQAQKAKSKTKSKTKIEQVYEHGCARIEMQIVA